mmetsp:Transcript_20102/g.34621  ORF Transcript_20102/g.34621 Transcript_20102/m.34621 type:complete len:252 (+) Transcript_20102:152-907(+)
MLSLFVLPAFSVNGQWKRLRIPPCRLETSFSSTPDSPELNLKTRANIEDSESNGKVDRRTFVLKSVAWVGCVLAAELPLPQPVRSLLQGGAPSPGVGDPVVSGQELQPCAASSACISTASGDVSQKMPRWIYDTFLMINDKPDGVGRNNLSLNKEQAKEELRAILESFPGSDIVVAEGDYMHVTFRDPVFGFLDDVEFVFEPDNRTVSFRCESRGPSDAKAQRRRMEGIRQLLQWDRLDTHATAKRRNATA